MLRSETCVIVQADFTLRHTPTGIWQFVLFFHALTWISPYPPWSLTLLPNTKWLLWHQNC